MAGPTMLMARSANRAIDFEALAKGSSFGILVMDLHGTVIFVNPQYTSITGARADALLGQSFPTLGCKTPERLHRSPQWRALVQCGQWSGKLPCQTPGSESGSMWLTLQKVDACDGRPTLVVAVCSMTHPLGWRDTELQRSEAARIASEQGWRFALEVAGDGVWDWNITTGEVAFSHNWKNMLGLGEDDIPPRIEEWTNRLMDEDRAAALATVDGVLKGSAPHFQQRGAHALQGWQLEMGIGPWHGHLPRLPWQGSANDRNPLRPDLSEACTGNDLAPDEF